MLRDRVKINAVVDTSDVDDFNIEQNNKGNVKEFAEWLAASAAHDACYLSHPQGGLYKRDMNAIQLLYIFANSDKDLIHEMMGNFRNAPVGIGVGGIYRTFVFVADFSENEKVDFEAFLEEELEENLKARILTEMIIVDFNKATYTKVHGGKIQDKQLRKVFDNIENAAGMTTEKRVQSTETKRSEYKKHLEDIKKPRNISNSLFVPMVLIILVNLIVFVIDVICMSKFDEKPLETLGIQYNKLVWDGEWWRLITSIFLHDDIYHFGGNMLLLVLISKNLHNYYSKIQYSVIYLLTGLVGSFCTLLFMEENVVSLGASGAVMGIGGVLFFRMFFGDNSRYLRRASNGLSIVIMIAYSLFYGLTQTDINNWAHFSGFVTGFIIAWAIHLYEKDKQKNNSETSA